jgi:hypothetical protein
VATPSSLRVEEMNSRGLFPRVMAAYFESSERLDRTMTPPRRAASPRSPPASVMAASMTRSPESGRKTKAKLSVVSPISPVSPQIRRRLPSPLGGSPAASLPTWVKVHLLSRVTLLKPSKSW